MSGKTRFFDVEKNIIDYIEMRDGFDGRQLIDTLKNFLEHDSTLLELGMGSGTDLSLLSKLYNVTGSDYSKPFLDIYGEKEPDADLILLDAVTLETERTFDCIFSNKVLHHLSTEDLSKSLKKQKSLLNNDGILFHTFWQGDNVQNFEGLHFIKYEMETLVEITKVEYSVVDIGQYAELIQNDSIYIVLKPNKKY